MTVFPRVDTSTASTGKEGKKKKATRKEGIQDVPS